MNAKEVKAIKIDKTAALCGMVWFALIIDACYTWLIPSFLLYFLGCVFVIYATILLSKNKGLLFSKKRKTIFLLIFCFAIFKLFTKLKFVITPLQFTPILCVVFWSKSSLSLMYDYFKKFIIFYSILSLFIEALVLSGIWHSLPNVILPPQDNVQENIGIINHYYGLFVLPESPTGLTFYRAMGPLREGGHFSIFVGFTYFVEKAVYNRRNLWLFIAGFLTLSPNFLIIFLITESYCAITQKRFFKTMMEIIFLFSFLASALFFSPSFIKEKIVHIVLERSLEENVQNAEMDGYMALLDGRADDLGLQMYYKYKNHSNFITKLIGISGSDFDEGYVLSDFRYILLRYGYFGFFIIVLCSMKISFGENSFLYGLCVFLFFLLVLLTRAWMMEQHYIWAMMLLAVNTMSTHKQQNELRLSKSLKNQ